MSLAYRQKKFMFPPATVKPPPIPPEKAIEMALTNDLEAFEAFMQDNMELINMKDERGNVALHVACSRGQLDMIAYLLRKGANIDIQDMYGNTPLLYAIDKNQNSTVELLIRMGASVHISDFRGNTPLHSACTQNNREIVELLLRQGADPEAMDFGSKRPTDRTNSYPIQQMLDRYIYNKKDEGESMTKKTINWVGFGIGLGIGMGIALAKQQEVFAKQLREEEQRKKEEDERRRTEMEQRLKKGTKKEAAPQARRLLD